MSDADLGSLYLKSKYFNNRELYTATGVLTLGRQF
jgi:hypothetical protein